MATRLTCRECYSSVELKYTGKVNALLKERKACLFCNYWIEMIAQRDDTNSVRIDGVSFIRFHDGRFAQVPKSRLLLVGKIPHWFKRRLQSNAIFTSSVEEGRNGST